MPRLCSSSHIAVLYGTETGTAQEVANRISTELRILLHILNSTSTTSSSNNNNFKNVKISLLPIDDTNPFTDWGQNNNKKYSHIIFVVATAGNGDPPRSMRKNWKLLLQRSFPRFVIENTDNNNNNEEEEKSNLSFAVFGLGDSTYSRFNYMAKMLHNRLERLGGEPLCYRALGDDEDQQGYESELRPFLVELFVGLGLKEQEQQDEDSAAASSSETKILKIPPIWPSIQQQKQDENNSNKNNSIPPLWNIEIISSSSVNNNNTTPESNNNKIASQRRERNSSNNSNNNKEEQETSNNNNKIKPIDIETYLTKHLGLDTFHLDNMNRITSEDHFQDVRFLSIFPKQKENNNDSNNNNKHKNDVLEKYLPGDTFAMYPRNPEDAVTQMLSVCGDLSPDDIIIVRQQNKNKNNNDDNNSLLFLTEQTQMPFFNLPFRVEDFFTWVIDLQANTSRQLLWTMIPWCHDNNDNNTNARTTNNKEEKQEKEEKEELVIDYDEVVERLQQLSRLNMDDYMEYITRERRPIYEVLSDFNPLIAKGKPSTNNDNNTWLSYIISSLNPISVRHFSICRYFDFENRKNKNKNNEIELLIALHKVTTPMKRNRRGLCSSFIEDFLICDNNNCNNGSSSATTSTQQQQKSKNIFGFIERKVHTLPFPNTNETTNFNPKFLLVGPGTGIAPIRAVTQRILSSCCENKEETENDNSSSVLVFTGHRHPEKDFPFKQEWEELNSNKNNIEIISSFSRFSPGSDADAASSNKQKSSYPKYVQHAISNNNNNVSGSRKQQVANLLSNKETIVIISGNATQMPKDVRDAFIDCLVDCKIDSGREEANKRLDKMRIEGRYVVDAWA